MVDAASRGRRRPVVSLFAPFLALSSFYSKENETSFLLPGDREAGDSNGDNDDRRLRRRRQLCQGSGKDDGLWRKKQKVKSLPLLLLLLLLLLLFVCYLLLLIIHSLLCYCHGEEEDGETSDAALASDGNLHDLVDRDAERCASTGTPNAAPRSLPSSPWHREQGKDGAPDAPGLVQVGRSVEDLVCTQRRGPGAH